MKARYNYRIYPTLSQQDKLAQVFGCARYVWNEALSIILNTPYEEQWPSRGDIMWMVTTQQKAKPGKEWLREVSSVVLQQSVMDFSAALKNFFEQPRVKFPRFKKRTGKQSARFSKSAFRLKGNKLFLAKLGLFKVRWSRPLPAEPSSVTVLKNSAGQYHVSFVVDVQQKSVDPVRKSIGVDLGLKVFAFPSVGKAIHSPDYKRLNRKIACVNRQLARQQKGSNRWQRTKLKLSKLHLKIANIRKDFLHQLSTRLIRENQTVSLEDLSVSGMLKNRWLSRAISQQGWRQFRRMCEAKAKQYKNRTVSVVSRWEPTSQLCSCCGFRWGKLDLAVRVVECVSCLAVHDRDQNAAVNIDIVGAGLAHDLKRTLSECKSTPVATRDDVSSQPYEATQLSLCF